MNEPPGSRGAPLPQRSRAGRGRGSQAGKGGAVRAQRPLAGSLGLCFSFAALSANALPIYLSVLPPQPTVWSPVPLPDSSFLPPTPSPLPMLLRTPLLSPESHHRNNHAQNIRLHGQAALAAGPELARAPPASCRLPGPHHAPTRQAPSPLTLPLQSGQENDKPCG